MKLDVWFVNTNPEEKEETLAFLRAQGAEDITVGVDSAGSGCDEYRCALYVDTDEDVQAALRVMLYYNDRLPQQLAGWEAALPPQESGPERRARLGLPL